MMMMTNYDDDDDDSSVMMQQRESKPHQSLSPLSSFIYIQSAISVLFLHHHPHHQHHHHHHHHHHQDIAVRVMKSMHIFKLPQLMKTMWKKYRSNIWFLKCNFFPICKTYLVADQSQHICPKFQKFSQR